MPNDNMTWFEKLKGKRYRDIELPAEGPTDPRLKGKSVREAFEKVRPSLKALKETRDKQRGD